MTRPVACHRRPDCGTARNVPRIIGAVGATPVITAYLNSGRVWPHLPGRSAAA